MPATSREAHRRVKERGLDTRQIHSILAVLRDKGSMTGQELGAHLDDLGEYVVTKRRGFMVRVGVAEEVEKRRCRVTGNWAHPIRLTPEGLAVLEGASMPVDPGTRGERQGAVNRAAKAVLDARYSWAGMEPALDALDAAMNRLEGQAREPAPEALPVDSVQRRDAAAKGYWIRGNGAFVKFTDMREHHVLGAIRSLRAQGVPDDYYLMRCLLEVLPGVVA